MTEPPSPRERSWPRPWRPGEPIEPVARLLRRGGVLAIPTESSYGLAVDPASAEGVLAVARVKGRSQEMGLPVVAASRRQIVALGVPGEALELDLLAPLWPAPLTVVLPREPSAPPLPAGRGATVAVRIPSCSPLLTLLGSLGTALTATSANRTGEPPVLDPADLPDLLDGEDWMWVDGGTLAGGPPSTLVRLERSQGAEQSRPGRWTVLRTGAFDVARLPAVDDLTQ